jgi:hypothetical protein
MKTAILNYSLIFCNFDNTFPNTYYLSANSPLPEKSTLNGAIIESTIINANYSSIMAPAACMSRLIIESTVKARPTMILFRTASESRS